MQLTLVNRRTEAVGVESFFFTPSEKFEFKPGQYVYLTLPKLDFDDSKGATRHFTITSTPIDKDIMFTTKIRPESGYKTTLNNLPLGTSLEASLPNGTFTLSEEKPNPQVFVSGGIGITPFRSMIKHQTENNFKTPLYLLPSYKTAEDVIYKNDFQSWLANNPNFHYNEVITSSMGRVNGTTFNTILEKIGGRVDFWICGPPEMVMSVESVLQNISHPNKGEIFSEKFTGY